MATIIGFLLINKPEGITSYNCIAYIKKVLRLDKKHSGVPKKNSLQQSSAFAILRYTDPSDQYSGRTGKADTSAFVKTSADKSLDRSADRPAYVKTSVDRQDERVAIKVGHAGTLDPFATGLLIIAIDRQATREIQQLMALPKEYVATGKLGELTDTLDKTGTVIETMDATNITEEQLHATIHDLGTSYKQAPPIYSALKHHGVPLYKLAREKRVSKQELQAIVTQKEKEVYLYSIELLNFSNPYFTIRAHVSHGTYMRSLVHDIAKKVGSYATTYELRRTKIGNFSVEDAVELDGIKTLEDIEQHIHTIDDFMRDVTKS